MTTPLWCLLIATFLPFVWVFAGQAFRYRQFGNIDNNHPRLTSAGDRTRLPNTLVT